MSLRDFLKVSHGQTSWQRGSFIFKFHHLNLILLLETCFKVLMKEIKIGKAVETLDGKNQTAKWLIALKYRSVISENIINAL